MIAVARHFLDDFTSDQVSSRVREDVNWSDLLEISLREGMASLLAVHLQQIDQQRDLVLPLEPFQKALCRTFVCNGRMNAELQTLGSALHEKGIRAIVLKGVALLETTYGRQLGLRPLSDIDLLVNPSELPAIQQTLQESGFVAPTATELYFTNGPVSFDVHTSLVGSGRIRRRGHAFLLDGPELWEKAFPLSDRSDSLLSLGHEHQFLHLAVHALKHSFSRLIWLVDLALVARRVDWKSLMGMAKDTNTLRPTAYAVHTLESLFGIQVSRRAYEALPTMNALEKSFLRAVTERRATEPAGELLVAFSIPGWTKKLAYLRELAFPRREVLADVFPTAAPRWLFLCRLKQMWNLACARAGQILR